MINNFNQEWMEALTQRDAVAMQLGLQLNDNLALPWQDGVSFMRPGTTIAATGQTSQALISEDLPMAPQLEAANFLLGFQISLADSFYGPGLDGWLTMISGVKIGPGAPFRGPFLADRLQIFTDIFTPSLVGNLSLAVSDNLNYWLDPQANFSSFAAAPLELDLVIGCPHLNNWLDNATETLGSSGLLTEVLSDSLTMSDSFTLALGYVLNVAEPMGVVIYNFATKPDANPLDPNFWTQITAGFTNPLQVVGGVCEGTLAGAFSGMLYTGSVFSNDQAVEITIGAISPAIYILLRSNLTGSYYQCYVNQGAIALSVVAPAIGTVPFGINFTGTVNPGDKIVFRAQGNLITAALNGVVVAGGTDSSLSSGGVGLGLFSSALAAVTVSSFTAYSLNDALVYNGTGIGFPLPEGLVDTLTMSDAFVGSLGGLVLTEVLSDTMTMSDKPLSEAMDFLLQLFCPHLNNWQDAATATLVAGGLTEVLSDTLTMSDALGLGYGEGTVDALTFSDASGVGYGDLIADTLTMSDSLALGFGDNISDTLTMSDALGLGYGEGNVDALTLSDATGVGYGDLIADALTLGDAFALTYGLQVTDSLTLSDALRLGYGDLIADSLVMSDQFNFSIGMALISEVLADTLTMSDALGIGYGQGQVDSLTLSDASGVGYGDIISDSLTLSDLPNLGYGSGISDSLVLSDAVSLGYGDALSDFLSLSDALALGYGELIADSLAMSDAALFLFAFSKALADTLIFSDSMSLGYGASLTDTLAMGDALAAGYGQGSVDQLVFSDATGLGYGDIVSDSLTMSDAFNYQMSGTVMSEILSDQLILSEALGLGYGDILTDQLTMADPVFSRAMDFLMAVGSSESANWADAVVLSLPLGEVLADTMTMSDALGLGYGEGTVDQLTFSDASGLGYGDQIADQMVMADAFTFSLGGVAMAESLSDTLTMSDSLLLGYGDIFGDVMTMSEKALTPVFEWDLTISCPHLNNWQDAFSEQLITSGLTENLSDSMTMSDGFSYQLLVQFLTETLSDALTMSDVFGSVLFFGAQILITLSDQMTMADWFGPYWVVSDQMVQYDFFVSSLQSPEIDLAFFEQMVMGDSVILQPVAQQPTDQMFMYDSLDFVMDGSAGQLLYISEEMWMAEVFSYNLAVVTGGEIDEFPADTLTLADVLAIGYGDLIAEQLVQGDAFTYQMSGTVMSEILSDQLVMSDALGLGYGEGNVDQLTLSDRTGLGYGFIISDTLTLSDASVLVLALLESPAETLTMSDQTGIGYGLQVTDQLTMADAFSSQMAGTIISEVLSDQLAFSDSMNYFEGGTAMGMTLADQLAISDALTMIGYGDLISDQLAMSDQLTLGENLLLSDQMAASDSLQELFSVAFTLSDTLVMSDAFAKSINAAEGLADSLAMSDALLLGYGNQFVEQLVLVEGPYVGFGDLIADQLAMSDGAQVLLGIPGITLAVNDHLTMAEQISAGYGGMVSDVAVMADAAAYMESMLVLLGDATPGQLDAFQTLLAAGLGFSDALVFQDQLATTWGIIIGTESLAMADSLVPALQNLIVLALTDSEVANWLDAVLANMVFAPGHIILASLVVMSQVIVNMSVNPKIQASDLDVAVEMEEA